MGKQIPVASSFNLPDGRTVTIETGKLATQADGSVVVKMGNTMLLATVVSNKDASPDQSFFPLSVDYQEKFASAGRIPGNFFRRESKLNDYEILICRLIDRAIRPLFPEGYRNETQINISLISGDKETFPDAFACLAASAALAVSDIPFGGPISEVRVARINGEYKVNPSRTELLEADIDIIVGATMKDVTMVEGEAKECNEADLVEAIKIGHEAIKVQIQAQLELAEKVGATVKRVVNPLPENEELKAEIQSLVTEKLNAVSEGFYDKQTRKKKFTEVYSEMLTALTEVHDPIFMIENTKLIDRYFDKIKKNVVRMMVLNKSVRLDGRKLDEIRPIWTEVDYLPSTHGSAIFNRGETQSLTSLTLGTKLDEQMNDTAMEMTFEKFILHYNFPAFSVGEIKPNRGPGRREVGHANLAGRSIKKVLPVGSPYTIRIVSDILESNGSSSMATVCAASLALMDGGIKITSPISGIAMGMIAEEGKVAILSDILGDEDALGDMDFKVTGTKNGICGCQMDIKIDGLPYEMLEKALDQARAGRIHIIDKMNETIAEPREDMKPHAPRIVEVIIERSFIGAVIGPGGSVIQEMQRETGTVINITEVGDKGVINIASPNKDSIEKALARVHAITHLPEVDNEYEATVRQIMPYGAFVDFMGKSGLLHVSEISNSRIDNVEDVLKEGDVIKVKLIEVDKKTGKYRLSMKALLPGGDKKREERQGGGEDRRSNDRGDRNDRGGDRRPQNKNPHRRD